MTPDPLATLASLSFSMFVIVAGTHTGRRLREHLQEREAERLREPRYRAALFELLRATRYALARTLHRLGQFERKGWVIRAAAYRVRAWRLRREIATLKAKLQQPEPVA